MSTLKRPSLELSTFIDRQSFTIDGQAYELRNHGELAELSVRRLDGIGEQIDALELIESPTKEDEERYLALSREYVSGIVIDLPEEVLVKLELRHTTPIILHFLGVSSQGQRQATTKRLRQQKRQTGAKSSRR